MTNRRTTVTHFGAYEIESDGRTITSVHPFSKDPDPSLLGYSLTAVTENRVLRPSVRKSWLETGPGSRPQLRGNEPFVEVPWDTVLDLVAQELDRVRSKWGNSAIFGGSYGWASAGRFHNAQSQIHRFLASIGGYTASKGTYSFAAAEAIVPHVLGEKFRDLLARHTSWPVIVDATELIVAFGGIPLKNSQVQHGGQGRHTLRAWLEAARDRGTRFVNISPQRDDLVDSLGAQWLPARPGSDVAIILGLIHTLVSEGLEDRQFLDSHCVGWPQLCDYITGQADGVAKTVQWAESLSGLPADQIRTLAIDMASSRTLINASWSLQRAEHGEQIYWAVVSLAAALGQIGIAGGGFGLGYGATGTIGNGAPPRHLPGLPVPKNPIDAFVPVARLSDMLLNPGATFDYDGGRYTYPDVRLIYWAGGNPFHHHQDLNRLVAAWRKPETVIVNDPFWTATSKRADIVLPVTTTLERIDLGGAPSDEFMFAMPAMIERVGEARDDYEIFSDVAERLGAGPAFTEGRDTEQWVRYLYAQIRSEQPGYPDFDEFFSAGFVQHIDTQAGEERVILFEDFRSDPDSHPLQTPSGRIELFSETIAGFGYEDCPGHVTWLEPSEWLGSPQGHPLHLTSSQPSTRLHSQLDHGVTSQHGKVAGREAILINPEDALIRRISDGDIVRVFNLRGACFAGAKVTTSIRPGVVQLATGAWFDPIDPATPGSPCAHGNPNVLTIDSGTSRLGQGPVAHTCMVEVEFAGDPPLVTAHRTPIMAANPADS